MQPFTLIPLVACVVCAAYCLATTPANYNRTARRAQLLGKALFLCPAVWALCEVAWNVAPSAEAGAVYLRPAAAAMILIGPLSVEVVLALTPRPYPLLRHMRVAVYATCLALCLAAWTTPWMFRGLVDVPWGRAYEPGPLFALPFAFIAGCGIVAYRVCRQIVRDVPDATGRIDGTGILASIFILVALGSLSDGILPILGVQIPRFTTVGFAVLAGAILWSMSRPQGYIFATPAIISQEILQSLNEGVAFTTLDDRILLANEGMENLLGEDPGRLLGQPFRQYLPDLPLSEEEQRIDAECELQPRAGAPITVAASVSTARDQRGDPLGLVIILRDLREVKLLRSRLITSSRLAAVGQLAAGVAHEINNPIAFVRTNLSVLAEHWTTIEKALADQGLEGSCREALIDGAEIIGESIEGIDRAAHIVRGVREFSHPGKPQREPTDLNELLERVSRIASPQLGPGIRLDLDRGDIPLVPASSRQLEQVFLNLIVNAIHAVGARGSIRLTTGREEDRVVVRVSDDGCGIVPDEAERIFDPFFTTKPVGKGTGLGLSISHEIIRNHGGEIDLEPESGRGACFCVRLPIEDGSS